MDPVLHLFIQSPNARWPYLPATLACVYAAMAALCAVQTFSYLKGDLRFAAMGVEYLSYGVILVFLFRRG